MAGRDSGTIVVEKKEEAEAGGKNAENLIRIILQGYTTMFAKFMHTQR